MSVDAVLSEFVQLDMISKSKHYPSSDGVLCCVEAFKCSLVPRISVQTSQGILQGILSLDSQNVASKKFQKDAQNVIAVGGILSLDYFSVAVSEEDLTLQEKTEKTLASFLKEISGKIVNETIVSYGLN